MFERLEQANLTLQLSKCKIGTQSCDFLGHHVGNGAISPQDTKVEAISSFAIPKQARTQDFEKGGSEYRAAVRPRRGGGCGKLLHYG